ncbi:rRNA maturation RNase YbeY [Alkalibacillus salilacus]|uniref:Endoribonuclease YbeY n=1 Tax=Alkalibacillus salilacus TaxID=284582 RepID=A0ABT9VCS1_9BACI|nr:putative rRNA maturation factor [Alkalibacillus salilacus]
MQIDFIDETELVENDLIKLLEDVLQYAANEENIEESAEMSVTIVDDETIKQINADYREKDYATDVISFALEEQGEGELDIVGDDLPVHLGDIVISFDRAKAQANEYDHSLNRELAFLSVHGLLHLIGYDHETKADEKAMFQKQESILQSFGLKRNET